MNSDLDPQGLFDFEDESDLVDPDEEYDDDLEDEEKDLIYADIYGLTQDDKPIVDQLIDCVRKLIARPDIDAQQIHGLAQLLWALQRLPARTPDVHIYLSLGRRYENSESRHWVLELGNNEFRLESASYIIIIPEMGGDGLSDTIFEAEVGGYRSAEDPYAIVSWLEEFEAACTNLEETIRVDNYGDDPIDWSSEPDPDIWDRLPRDNQWLRTIGL